MKEGDMDRRGFLKTSIVYGAGKLSRLGDLSRLVEKDKKSLAEREQELKLKAFEEVEQAVEARIFQRVQEELRNPIWKDYSSIAGNIVYLTDADWTNTAKIPKFNATRERIRTIFYAEMESIVNKRLDKIHVSKDIYIMMAAKESNFGTSFLAQVANNPFSINTDGKDGKDKNGGNTGNPVLIDFKNTIKWIDDGTEYDFYVFKDLPDACYAFELLFKDWKSRSKYKGVTDFSKDDYKAIEVIAVPWGAGKNGAIDKYTSFLARVKERRF